MKICSLKLICSIRISQFNRMKENEELDKKREWLEDEIEKIVKKQKDMELLERDLHDRDLSLQKKEALLREKDRLENKKSESSLRLSKVRRQTFTVASLCISKLNHWNNDHTLEAALNEKVLLNSIILA